MHAGMRREKIVSVGIMSIADAQVLGESVVQLPMKRPITVVQRHLSEHLAHFSTT